jgi:hypothetical protein
MKGIRTITDSNISTGTHVILNGCIIILFRHGLNIRESAFYIYNER